MSLASWCAIVNPAAGGGRAGRAWPAIAAALAEAGLQVEARFTTARGEGAAMAQAAVAEGHRRLVAVGGDGTLSEVALGALGPEGRGPNDLGLASWPAGTGRDVARRLALPQERGALARRLAESPIQAKDLACLKPWGEGAGSWAPRLVVNAASAGLSAEVLQALDVVPVGLPGPLRYALATLRVLASGGSPSWAPRLWVDDAQPWPSEGLVLAAVALGPTFGGGMAIAPGADDGDGLLDLVGVQARAPWRLAAALPALYQGQLLGLDFVRHARARRIAWEGGGWVEADGELLGPGGAAFEVRPGALPLLGGL